jgi:TetR/AcrR family transcriptional regulator, lmrAB and yxaGH operons repressor
MTDLAQSDPPPSVRDRMVDSAALLLAKQGYQATSFSEVLAASGAPRGSIYHHFPEGKDQLVAIALDTQAARVIGGLDRLDGRTPAGIVAGFMRWWRLGLERSDFAVGCSLVGVTTSAGPGDLRDEAGDIFERWTDRLTGLLAAAGVDAGAAASFATLLLAATEGAVVIARARHSFEPFDTVAEHLAAQARLLPGAASSADAYPTDDSGRIR